MFFHSGFHIVSILFYVGSLAFKKMMDKTAVIYTIFQNFLTGIAK